MRRPELSAAFTRHSAQAVTLFSLLPSVQISFCGSPLPRAATKHGQRAVGCLRGSILILLMALSGCGGQQRAALPYHELVAEVLDPSRIARLDTPQAEIVTSYDRTGGNTDYSNYLGEGPGDWKILADLEGPGFVSRFWTTGGHSRKQRFRFYFDKEKKPRIDATVDELSQGVFRFLSPLARYEQGCLWSYVPMSYAKRLRYPPPYCSRRVLG